MDGPTVIGVGGQISLGFEPDMSPEAMKRFFGDFELHNEAVFKRA